MIQKRATSVAFFFLSLFALSHASRGLAQSNGSEAVYRCGNAYTNDAAQAKREHCKLLESGAVVTIPTHQRAVAVTQNRNINSNAGFSLAPKPRSNAPSSEQQARDHEAKVIIEAELKKTEAQLSELRQQYAVLSAAQDSNRKLAVKQQIDRAEVDVASLKRELKR